MTHPPTPHQPLTISRFLLGGLVTGSIVIGAIAGLALLFLADGVIDVGDDPAIPTPQQEVPEYASTLQARLDQLEQLIQRQQTETPAQAATDDQTLNALRKDVETTSEQTRHLQAQVEAQAETISKNETSDQSASAIALGLTQLKMAFDNDLPLAPGLAALERTVTHEGLQQSLRDLSTIVSENLPTRKEIYADLQRLKSGTQPNAAPAPQNWQERAKSELNRFVNIRPTDQVQQAQTITHIENAVRLNDMQAALEDIRTLPESAQQAMVYKKIELRVRAEMALHNLVNNAAGLVGLSNRKALY